MIRTACGMIICAWVESTVNIQNNMLTVLIRCDWSVLLTGCAIPAYIFGERTYVPPGPMFPRSYVPPGPMFPPGSYVGGGGG